MRKLLGARLKACQFKSDAFEIHVNLIVLNRNFRSFDTIYCPIAVALDENISLELLALVDAKK